MGDNSAQLAMMASMHELMDRNNNIIERPVSLSVPNVEIRNIDGEYQIYKDSNNVGSINPCGLMVSAEYVTENGIQLVRYHLSNGETFDLSVDDICDMPPEEPVRIQYSHCKSCGAPVDSHNRRCGYCGVEYGY